MNNTSAARLTKIYRESTLKDPYKRMSLAKRYWIYQWERLPVIPLVLMGISVGAAVMIANNAFSWTRLIVSTVLVSAYLLQIRFADEPKDYEHDNKFYPTRPVQRGVITLTDLRHLRNFMIAVFFLAAVVLQSWLIFFLACLQQFYSLLTRKEFFIRDWLRDHFFIYMFSHYFQLVILSWLALTIVRVPADQKLMYLMFTLSLMAIVELARKIQETSADKAKDTYSAILGRSKAIGFYLILVVAVALYASWLLVRIGGDVRALLILGLGLGFTLAASVRYLQSPDKKNTKILQSSSLLYYLMCAIAIIAGA